LADRSIAVTFTDSQKRLLLTNLARDKAENLRNEIRRMKAEAMTGDHSHLTPEQRLLGEQALQRAMASAERMLASLEQALKLAEEMQDEELDDADDEDGAGDRRHRA
jgi:hypothetical protein